MATVGTSTTQVNQVIPQVRRRSNSSSSSSSVECIGHNPASETSRARNIVARRDRLASSHATGRRPNRRNEPAEIIVIDSDDDDNNHPPAVPRKWSFYYLHFQLF